MKNFWRAMAILAVAMLPATAQVWDFTGNNLLNGTYNFRELILVDSTGAGSIGQAVIMTGTITFNSATGRYTESVNYIDYSRGAASFTDTGAYSIAPNGQGFMEHPYYTTGFVHGLVANGMFIGSSTESGRNELFIAVPASSATASTFSGNYTMDYFLTQGGASTGSWDSIAQLTANGAGNIGSVSVKTYVGTSSTVVNQTETGVSYSFTSGVGAINFPTAGQPAIGGTKQMLISPDGNFIFGGNISSTAPTYDFFIGVKRSSGAAPKLSGLYYQAGLNQSPGSLDTYWGAFNARAGTILEHQRYFALSNQVPLNYTGSAVYPESGATDYTDTISNVEYTVSQDGKIRIGAGQSPYLGLRIAVAGPTFNDASSNPYINPTGVINAASYAPFTTGVAPGELLSIYGSNLASSTVVTQGGQAFPTRLGGVRVLFNGGTEAPIYFVSTGQIAVIVPYGISTSIVQIQVERNGVLSNAVTAFRYLTSPGIFSQSQSGEGLAAALHPNFSLVTQDNPAKIGETVQIFLTGIGSVFPTIADGALGGTNQVQNGTVKAYIGNVAADVTYAGLAPGLAGLYQVNATVPTGAGSGNVFLDISTADSYTTQVALPVASAAASDAVAGEKPASKEPAHRR